MILNKKSNKLLQKRKSYLIDNQVAVYSETAVPIIY